jgi:D-alanyl-D-alanine carboxypeptidase (penicillin-binding protein 5/6)
MVGDPAGSLIVSLDGEKIGEYPVYALQDIPQAGWFGRLWDSVRYWFNHL